MNDQITLSFDDVKRLSRQREAIRDIMLPDNGSPAGPWLTVGQIVAKLRLRGIDSVATGVSACMRDLRKAKYGLHQLDTKRIAPGLYAHRLWRRA